MRIKPITFLRVKHDPFSNPLQFFTSFVEQSQNYKGKKNLLKAQIERRTKCGQFLEFIENRTKKM